MSQIITDQNTPPKADDELSLKEILSYLNIFKPYWKKALLYVATPAIIFGFIGFLAAATSPKEYDATCTLITDQVASTSGGSLSGLASLAGVEVPGANVSNSGEGLGADIYPLILSNKPFLVELSKTPLYFATEKRSITLEKYFRREIKKNVIEGITDFLFHPITGFRKLTGKQVIDTSDPKSTLNFDSLQIRNAALFFSNEAYIEDLTSENKKLVSILTKRIKFEQQGKLITLSVKMPDPWLSAEATKTVLNLMIKYITKFKISKQLENLRFLERSTADAEQNYKQAQQRLANFKDNNYGVIFESIQSKEQQLQNEFTLAFTIYNQLSTQLEQARIQLKKDTPLFTVVEPVYIPSAVSSDPKKAIISYVSIGILIGIMLTMILFIRIFIRSNKKNNISK